MKLHLILREDTLINNTRAYINSFASCWLVTSIFHHPNKAKYVILVCSQTWYSPTDTGLLIIQLKTIIWLQTKIKKDPLHSHYQMSFRKCKHLHLCFLTSVMPLEILQSYDRWSGKWQISLVINFIENRTVCQRVWHSLNKIMHCFCMSLFKDHTVTKQTSLNRFIFQGEIKPQLKAYYLTSFSKQRLQHSVLPGILHSWNWIVLYA